MAPMIHKLTFPRNLASQFANGSLEAYKAYAFAYCKANNPEMQIVTINGEQQDPFKQGYLLAVYKNSFAPGDMAEKRAEAKKKGGKK